MACRARWGLKGLSPEQAQMKYLQAKWPVAPVGV